MTETELKPRYKWTPRFGVMVSLPVGLINYRALEEASKGIEAEIETETSYDRREKLSRIKKDIKKILREA